MAYAANTSAKRKSAATVSVIGSGTLVFSGVFIDIIICVAASTIASSRFLARSPFSGSSLRTR